MATGSGSTEPPLCESDPDETGELPHHRSERLEGRLVEDRDADDGQARERGRQLPDGARIGLVGAGDGQHAGLLDPGRHDFGHDDLEFGRIGAGPPAVDDRIDRPQHAKEGPAASAILRRTADEARDLHELDEHAPDAGQGRDRPQCRERIVTGLDLDLGEGLQQR